MRRIVATLGIIAILTAGAALAGTSPQVCQTDGDYQVAEIVGYGWNTDQLHVIGECWTGSYGPYGAREVNRYRLIMSRSDFNVVLQTYGR